MPTAGDARNRALDRKTAKRLWEASAVDWGNGVGCYVFALRRGPGYWPIYVGKTAKQTFAAECFNDRNYRLLHEAMTAQVGTLVVFLVKYERTRGRFNAEVIGDLEKFLVEKALERNPKLKNTAYAKGQPGFAITGVHRERGRPTRAAQELKRALLL